ncbi:RsmF rRNA methyltransferase first C-terminal domain-containing protein [Paenibacillus xylaniclasticus]|uniref:RsmF rRNA methyltransferase first C-terminal domain-containing protein n=1 Tax=Paenibacillus xylaniclasticus TaxID=588083 RepID=UPI00176BC6C2|nr:MULTISPECIES: RsmF rRNA methyltransferase first C-terminal domain-containing protein [Paenibacillus]GFN30259.1 tRNA/rRNA methyltransferase [Paenibacillus curdlanolyticus]
MSNSPTIHPALPAAYIQQTRELLGDEADTFLASYNAPRAYGLRLNPLKINTSDILEQEELLALRSEFRLTPIPWCRTGYYYDEETRPGKHPYHAAGLYYIQEPSAMSAAEALEAQPGETILDLAAAPGGKTTQIAGAMQGEGLLIANEIHPARAKILSENVERCGIRNAVVTCAAPDQLSARFPAMFDRIMLDAPCSGEGMFRKDAVAIAEWSPEHVQMCADRQADILEHAAIMLKPGGRLVYSTCTFNRSENEDAIAAFIQKHPNFTVLHMERLWPHQCKGEGHFVAVLTKSSEAEDDIARLRPEAELRPRRRGKQSKGGSKPSNAASDMAIFDAFAKEHIPHLLLGPGEPIRFGDALYWLPHSKDGQFTAESLEGLKVVRPGLQLGELKTKRIEPAHSLALALQPNEITAAKVVSYRAESPEIAAYLRGETLQTDDGLSGWTIVAADGYPLGWAKASSGQLKNHLPKGLRRLT